MNYKKQKFEIAFTYSNTEESRKIIDHVHSKLVEKIKEEKIFLDYKQPHKTTLISEHLPTVLPIIYGNSNIIIMCLAKGYEESDWCGIEYRNVLDLLKKKENKRLIIIKVDETELPIQLKNIRYISKEEIYEEEVIDEIVKRTYIKIKTELYKSEFELLPKEHYSDLSEKIKKNIESTEPPFFCERHNILENLKNKVDQNGIVFLEGPLLTGKTNLFKSFSQHIKKGGIEDSVFVYSLSHHNMKINPNHGIKNVIDLYQMWGKSILHILFTNEILDLGKLKDENEKIYDYEETFKKELDHKYSYYHSYLKAMLIIIEKFLNDCGSMDTILYLTIHLDDFQEYIVEEVYDDLKKELEAIFIDPNTIPGENTKIRIIISTRYFLKKRPIKSILVNLKNLNIEEIKKYINKKIDSVNEECLNEISKKIFEYTSGHPWFVVRFLKIYLHLRANNRSILHPLELTDKIMKTGDYWILNEIFGKYEESLFLSKLRNIVNYKEGLISDHVKNFLREAKFDKFKNDIHNIKDNPILKEAGLIQFDGYKPYDFGNKIIKKYFHDEVL